MSKFDFALIVTVISGCALWTEHGHRIAIDAPAPVGLSAGASACPDSDNTPYSANCLVYLAGGDESAASPPAPTAARAAVYAPRPTGFEAAATPAACPDNDNVPYSASCLRFLSGWWQPDTAARVVAPAVYARR